MQNCSVNYIYSGVYKINFPNGKIYIGISNNIYRRMLEHNTDFRNKLPIEYAIKKYGKIVEFDILEEIPAKNRNYMREREKYWIAYYQSNKKEKGYNISEGGDGADFGSNNHEAKFTEEEIQVIYFDLKEKINTSMASLANKYGVSMSTLSRINNGKTYYHSNINYPIRNPKEAKQVIAGINNKNSKINKELLNQIYDSLLNEQDVSMRQLAKRFGISQTVIQNINAGKTYINTNFTYPLRKPKIGVRKLTTEQVCKIIIKIKTDSNKSLAQIGRELNISSKTISAINTGTIYKQEFENYPIRKK